MLSFVNEQGYSLNGVCCAKLLANDHLFGCRCIEEKLGLSEDYA